MAKQEWTPGPWEYGKFFEPKKKKGTGFYVNAQRTLSKDSVLAWRICDVNIGYEDIATTEANARLIAAAPDLLEALQRMLAAHDADVNMGSLIAAGNGQAAEQARRAISKALGE